MNVSLWKPMMAAVVFSAVCLMGIGPMAGAESQPQQDKKHQQNHKKQTASKQADQKKADQQDAKQAQQKQVNHRKADQQDAKQVHHEQVNQRKVDLQDAKQVNQRKVDLQKAKTQHAQRLDKQHQQQFVAQQQQRLTVYRQTMDQQQRLHQQYVIQLQRDKRNAQYRYQQRYSTQMLEQQRRFDNYRTYNYDNDPYFYTPYDRRYNRGGAYYQTNEYGIQYLQQAVNYGYDQGFRAGMADREDRWHSDYQGSIGYQDGSYGYNGYIAQDDYNYYFREGFRRGYEDGYNGRYQYGHLSNGNYVMLGGVLGGIVSFQMIY